MSDEKKKDMSYNENMEEIINDFIILFNALPPKQQQIFKDFFGYFETFLKKFSKQELILLINFINTLLNDNSKKED